MEETKGSYIKVYSTENCPRCKQLKNELTRRDIGFEEVDMTSPEAMTELYTNGVFTISAPVLQVEDKFYTTKDLFNGSILNLPPAIFKS